MNGEMITMMEKQTISHLYRVDNYSIRKIVQRRGCSRITIRQVIREHLYVLHDTKRNCPFYPQPNYAVAKIGKY